MLTGARRVGFGEALNEGEARAVVRESCTSVLSGSPAETHL